MPGTPANGNAPLDVMARSGTRPTRATAGKVTLLVPLSHTRGVAVTAEVSQPLPFGALTRSSMRFWPGRNAVSGRKWRLWRKLSPVAAPRRMLPALCPFTSTMICASAPRPAA